MALSNLEKKRQENIRRNKELLSKLDLNALSNDIARDVEKSSSPQPTKKRKVVKPKTETKKVVEPSRRSRRLAGIQTELENPDEAARVREEEEEKERKKREYETLKRTKLFGDFNLIDLITDRKSGDMLFEDKVRNKSDQESPKVEDDVLSKENETLQMIQSLGGKFSAGDFYEEIKKKGINSDTSIDSKRKEFDSKRIFQKFDPLDVKLTHHRITAMMFHPATTDRVLAAGDTDGNLGIWAPDASSSEKPAITILRPHGRNISKILTPANELQKLYTASYDGSVRSLDLNKLSTSEVAYLSGSGSSFLGVSDINLVRDDPNLMYMTTLDGLFCRHDTRTKPKASIDYLRLHDKKIGGFAINPNNSYQIATASLDRTLRIWDLRKTGESEYSQFDDYKSAHMYGNYSSRLSVSCVDWNTDNHLVCNGYDDLICVFNYNDNPNITDWKSDYMPDFKAKQAEADEIIMPNNLHPMNKIRHNCQTGRWVSILKSRWQENPQDGMQKFIIANMNRGMDVYDQKGNILAHLNDEIGAVPAVCTLHPTQNWAVGGSASGKIYLIE